jgi:hypothetical protein
MTEGDQTYEVIEFTRENRRNIPVIYRVYFHPELNYFPIKWVRLDDGKLAVTTIATRHTTIKIDDQDLVVPLEVTVTYTKDSNTRPRTETHTLAANSLQINHEIDEKIFTLSTDGIDIIEDADKPRRLK